MSNCAARTAALALILMVSSSSASERKMEISYFRAKVIACKPIQGFKGEIRPVAPDPKFALELERSSSAGQIREAFAVHSPTKLFLAEAAEVVGKEFEFKRTKQDNHESLEVLGESPSSAHFTVPLGRPFDEMVRLEGPMALAVQAGEARLSFPVAQSLWILRDDKGLISALSFNPHEGDLGLQDALKRVAELKLDGKWTQFASDSRGGHVEDGDFAEVKHGVMFGGWEAGGTRLQPLVYLESRRGQESRYSVNLMFDWEKPPVIRSKKDRITLSDMEEVRTRSRAFLESLPKDDPRSGALAPELRGSLSVDRGWRSGRIGMWILQPDPSDTAPARWALKRMRVPTGTSIVTPYIVLLREGKQWKAVSLGEEHIHLSPLPDR